MRVPWRGDETRRAASQRQTEQVLLHNTQVMVKVMADSKGKAEKMSQIGSDRGDVTAVSW